MSIATEQSRIEWLEAQIVLLWNHIRALEAGPQQDGPEIPEIAGQDPFLQEAAELINALRYKLRSNIDEHNAWGSGPSLPMVITFNKAIIWLYNASKRGININGTQLNISEKEYDELCYRTKRMEDELKSYKEKRK